MMREDFTITPTVKTILIVEGRQYKSVEEAKEEIKRKIKQQKLHLDDFQLQEEVNKTPCIVSNMVIGNCSISWDANYPDFSCNVVAEGKVKITNPNGEEIFTQQFNFGPASSKWEHFQVAATAVKQTTLGSIFPAAFNIAAQVIYRTDMSTKREIFHSKVAEGMWGI